jgi:hypothetical protein
MEQSNAPIVLFTYNRPIHTQNILDSLALCNEAKDSVLYIFCDGAKENVDEIGLKKIEEVRKIVYSENRFKEVVVTIQEKNKGLSASIISGVTQVINEYGKIIVLEDDFKISPFFLEYMNDGLVRYQDNKSVAEIGGCNTFACGDKFPKYFVSPMAETLGWATWKNRWDFFNGDSIYLYNKINERGLAYKFNAYGSYDMMGMLLDQIFGKVNSWAIRWQAIMVLNNWYCIHANISYTQHIESFDATHATVNILPPLQLSKPVFETIEIKENENVIKALKGGYSGKSDYYGKFKSKYFKRRIKKKIKKVLLFFIPFGIVMLFKKDKPKNKNLDLD